MNTRRVLFEDTICGNPFVLEFPPKQIRSLVPYFAAASRAAISWGRSGNLGFIV
jgi:hypothetical protein